MHSYAITVESLIEPLGDLTDNCWTVDNTDPKNTVENALLGECFFGQLTHQSLLKLLDHGRFKRRVAYAQECALKPVYRDTACAIIHIKNTGKDRCDAHLSINTIELVTS